MEKRQRISTGQDYFLKFVAIFFDVMALLLVETVIGGSIVGIIGDLTFFLAYAFLKAPVFGKGSKNQIIVNGIAKLVPILSDFYPGFSIMVWKKNRVVREEDEAYNKAQEEAWKQKRLAQQEQAIQIENENRTLAEQNIIDNEEEDEHMAA